MTELCCAPWFQKQDKGKPGAGIRAPYLRVIGIQINNEGAGRTATINFTQVRPRESRER